MNRRSTEIPPSPAAVQEFPGEVYKGSLLGNRRSFLINKRYQLRASFLTVTVALVLLVFLNLFLHASTVNSAERILADSPELAALIRAQDRLQFFLIVLASVVYLVGVFLVTILETHRTAGAARNLGSRLDEVRRGEFGTRLKLRRGDNLQELEVAFNEMCRALQERAWEEVETLAQLARDAEKSSDATTGTRLAERLRELAERKSAALRR
jgi:methyl-accepting chemotaxis protein